MPKIIPTSKPDNNDEVDFVWLGQYVRYKRTSLGMGLIEAADMCGLSKTAYSNVELGRKSRVETFFTVLKKFGIRLSVEEHDDDKWI